MGGKLGPVKNVEPNLLLFATFLCGNLGPIGVDICLEPGDICTKLVLVIENKLSSSNMEENAFSLTPLPPSPLVWLYCQLSTLNGVVRRGSYWNWLRSSNMLSSYLKDYDFRIKFAFSAVQSFKVYAMESHADPWDITFSPCGWFCFSCILFVLYILWSKRLRFNFSSLRFLSDIKCFTFASQRWDESKLACQSASLTPDQIIDTVPKETSAS